jgi:hypothetical protein
LRPRGDLEFVEKMQRNVSSKMVEFLKVTEVNMRRGSGTNEKVS